MEAAGLILSVSHQRVSQLQSLHSPDTMTLLQISQLEAVAERAIVTGAAARSIEGDCGSPITNAAVDAVNGARWLQVNGVYAMSELPPLPAKIVYNIGFELLSENFKVRLGDFSVVAGIPSHGKSTWMNDLWCRVADLHGLWIAWASFEQQPQEEHRRNLRSWFGRSAVKDMGGLDIAQADRWIDVHHRFLVPKDDEDFSLEWV